MFEENNPFVDWQSVYRGVAQEMNQEETGFRVASVLNGKSKLVWVVSWDLNVQLML